MIKRDIEIMLESIDLVNHSNNLETVLGRYDTALISLARLTPYSKEQIKNAGYTLKKTINKTILSMEENRTTIINQAIKRNLRHEIDSLKTIKGKIRKLDTMYEKMKDNEKLEAANIIFLDDLYRNLKNDLIEPIQEQPDFSVNNQTTDINKEYELLLHNLQPSTISDSLDSFNISPEIIDLIWVGDGNCKNYTPSSKHQTLYGGITISITSSSSEEPSVLYLSLPVSQPPENTMIERPPYYPTYKGLSPEQRWLYWEFLQNPFSQKNDIGYVFLFYYGLERHLVSGNMNKAFDIIVKLRQFYKNNSFQYYTTRTLILTCISKQRSDLALKLLTLEETNSTSIKIEHLLILKYMFKIPLTTNDIIGNHTYFSFSNNRYIKNYPELFSQTFLELMQRDFHSDSIDLNTHFPVNINILPVTQEKMFANISLNSEMPIPIIENIELIRKISAMLNETHEIVKLKLKDLRKQGKF